MRPCTGEAGSDAGRLDAGLPSTLGAVSEAEAIQTASTRRTTTFDDLWEFNLAAEYKDKAPWTRRSPLGGATATGGLVEKKVCPPRMSSFR